MVRQPAVVELRMAARGGALTLAGTILSAVLGFLFSLLLARLLGPSDSGIVLQAIAFFTIALGIGRLGLDTCAVWILPPMVRSEPAKARATIAVLVGLAAAGATLLAWGWWSVTTVLAPGSEARQQVLAATNAAAVCLPAAAVMGVALAATRAFGGVLPYNAVANLAVPLLRVAILIGIAAAGGGVVLVAAGWGASWAVGALLALIVLAGQMRRGLPPGPREPAPIRRIVGFAVPRAVSAALEQSVIWLDVILVGVLAGNDDAGVYGVASRFVAAGVMAATAVRIVVAPRFSSLLAAEDRPGVTRLYRVTAGWILVLGTPVYLLLAGFAPTVLAWLGPGYDRGVPAMMILCLGSIVVLAAGNVQSLLLMTGRTTWAAANKVVVVVANILGNLALVPVWGMTGAAITWTASMVVDTALAVWQTRRATGITVAPAAVLRTATAIALGVAVPIGLVTSTLGQGLVPLLIGVVLALVGWCAACWVERDRLELRELWAVAGSRVAAGSASSKVGG